LSEHEPLALKYRPRRFLDVAGQRRSTAVLYSMARQRSLPKGLLLTGQHGSGKTTTARILAAAVHCQAEPGRPDVWPCLTCPACRAVGNGSHLGVLEIDAAGNGGVNDIRNITEMVSFGGLVVLLDEAHSMSKDAGNALLKVLEEPPPGTIFILLTTDPAKILPTVVSRCMTFVFRRLSPAVIAERLQYICRAEDFNAEPELLREIADRSDGAMRDAIMKLDQMASVGVTSLELYRKFEGETDFGPPLVDAMISGDHAALFARLDSVLEECGDFALISDRVTDCLTDVLRLLSKGEVSAQGGPLAARQALARRLDTARVVKAMTVLWDLKTKVGRVGTPRSALSLAAVMCSERLCAARPSSPANGHANGGNGHERLTPEALRQLTGV